MGRHMQRRLSCPEQARVKKAALPARPRLDSYRGVCNHRGKLALWMPTGRPQRQHFAQIREHWRDAKWQFVAQCSRRQRQHPLKVDGVWPPPRLAWRTILVSLISMSLVQYFACDRILRPTSVPHLNTTWSGACVLGFVAGAMYPPLCCRSLSVPSAWQSCRSLRSRTRIGAGAVCSHTATLKSANAASARPCS